MGDLNRLVSAAPVEITDGLSQTVSLATADPATNAVGLVVRNISVGIPNFNLYDSDMQSDIAISPLGSLKTANSQRIIGDNFEGTVLDPTIWTTVIANGSAATVANGIVTLGVAASSTSTIALTSLNYAEYVTGSPMQFSAGIHIPSQVASNTRRWGAFDASNGVFFELAGTILRVVTRKNGVDTAIASGSFTGNLGTSYTIDTNYHTYDIVYTAGSVKFLIDGTLLQNVSGNTAATYSATSNFKLRFENNNVGNATAVNLEIRSTALILIGLLSGNGPTGSGGLIVGPRKLATYQANCRLATRPYALSYTFTANTRRQFVTFFHPSTAVKTVKFREFRFFLESTSVACLLSVDLVRLSNATIPATGNPAITSVNYDSGDAAPELTVLALPTTSGTETGVIYSREFNLGVTGAASTVNPPTPLSEVILFSSDGMTEEKVPRIRAGVAEGWAITLDCNAAAVVKALAVVQFTEE